MQCTLSYIPTRLHSIGKPIVENFFVGEEIYYRCSPGKCEKPYQSISLYDISHNRNFNDSSSYPKEDVLFDINEDSDVEIIEEKEINISVIQSLNENDSFEKKIISPNNSELFAEIKLVHTPLPCMYSHCSFEISVCEEIVTSENYKTILGRKNATYKNLRRDIRQELTSIIYTNLIDNDSETEIISEL